MHINQPQVTVRTFYKVISMHMQNTQYNYHNFHKHFKGRKRVKCAMVFDKDGKVRVINRIISWSGGGGEAVLMDQKTLRVNK